MSDVHKLIEEARARFPVSADMPLPDYALTHWSDASLCAAMATALTTALERAERAEDETEEARTLLAAALTENTRKKFSGIEDRFNADEYRKALETVAKPGRPLTVSKHSALHYTNVAKAIKELDAAGQHFGADVLRWCMWWRLLDEERTQFLWKDAVERAERAEAALEARMRDKTLEDAAHIAERACLVPPDGGSPTSEEVAVCDEAAKRIRAMKSNGAHGSLLAALDAALSDNPRPEQSDD